jgi:hypothetical protein
METQADFKELLALFNARHVEYVVVGGYAMATHGAPRFTRDLDLYVRPTAENAARVMESLREFGFGSVGLSQRDFESSGQVVQLGRPPVRIDLVTSIDGVGWEEVDKGKVGGAYAQVPVPVIGRNELIRNKKAVGRKQDLADVEALGGAEEA